MYRLLLAALSAAAVGAVPRQAGKADNASDERRVLQASADICAADISGSARGVPDGKIDVMDVRPPSHITAELSPSSARLVLCRVLLRHDRRRGTDSG